MIFVFLFMFYRHCSHKLRHKILPSCIGKYTVTLKRHLKSLGLCSWWLYGKDTHPWHIAVRHKYKPDKLRQMWLINIIRELTVNIPHSVRMSVSCCIVCSGVASGQDGPEFDSCALPVAVWLLSSFLLYTRMIGSLKLSWVVECLYEWLWMVVSTGSFSRA